MNIFRLLDFYETFTDANDEEKAATSVIPRSLEEIPILSFNTTEREHIYAQWKYIKFKRLFQFPDEGFVYGIYVNWK